MISRSYTTTIREQRERFAASRSSAHSTEPEIFTFDCVPAQVTAVPSYAPVRPRKRCTRVMYPAKVRMHLPPPERSAAKRWLLVLVLVLLWQIYTEDPGDYHGPPPQGAEEEALKLVQLSSTAACRSRTFLELLRPDTTCPTRALEPDNRRAFDQSAGKSYMVALLVYHRLGTDN